MQNAAAAMPEREIEGVAILVSATRMTNLREHYRGRLARLLPCRPRTEARNTPWLPVELEEAEEQRNAVMPECSGHGSISPVGGSNRCRREGRAGTLIGQRCWNGKRERDGRQRHGSEQNLTCRPVAGSSRTLEYQPGIAMHRASHVRDLIPASDLEVTVRRCEPHHASWDSKRRFQGDLRLPEVRQARFEAALRPP